MGNRVMGKTIGEMSICKWKKISHQIKKMSYYQSVSYIHIKVMEVNRIINGARF